MNVFPHKIHKWVLLNNSNLPWRNTKNRTIYWLSEIILQQTRIVQETTYYHRFIEESPTINNLATTSEDTIIETLAGAWLLFTCKKPPFIRQKIHC